MAFSDVMQTVRLILNILAKVAEVVFTSVRSYEENKEGDVVIDA